MAELRWQRLLGALGCVSVLLLACTEANDPIFFGSPDAGGLAGLGGLGGSAGLGSAGRGGASGAAGQGGSAGAVSQPDAGGDAGCSADAECEDGDACTVERCAGGVCVAGELAAAGTPCGSQAHSECSAADSCDAQGVCQPNDEANGTACAAGSCTLGACVAGQAAGCPVEVAGAAPFTTPWSSVGRPDLYVGGCDSLGTPDYALVFTAPATGTFRFAVSALIDGTPYTGADPTEPFTEPPDGDAVLTVVQGGCAGGAATQVACNDDAAEDTRDAVLELPLTSGQVVTVYLNELTQSGGGTGTLTITQLP